MLWNELSYELQQRVIDRMVDLLKTEEDDAVVDGIIAGIHELECWSNTPCQIVGENNYIAIAQDPFPDENGWDS